MPYNFAAESFHTKKLCSRLSSSEVHFLYGNDKIVAFEAPFGGLRGSLSLSLSLSSGVTVNAEARMIVHSQR